MDSGKYMCDDQTVPRPATGKTPVRNLRVVDEVWKPALAAARSSSDGTITDVIIKFLRWYLREPGAKLPDRPARPAPNETPEA